MSNENLFDDIALEISNIGSVEREITINEETKVVMRTLSGDEEVLSHKHCEGLAGSAYINQNKIEVLAFSLKSINGKSLLANDYVGKIEITDGDKENIDDVKKHIHRQLVRLISSWSQSVIDSLFLHYIKLLTVSNQNVEDIDFTEPFDVSEELERDSSNNENNDSETIGKI